MFLKTAFTSWPFLDAVRFRNGIPPLTAQTIHNGKCSPSGGKEKLRKLWIIVHDLDQRSLKRMKTHIENDCLHTVMARQIDVVSIKAALVIKKNTRHGERELMAERLIRGLARVIAEQEACRIVLLGCGDASWTLELALSGGSWESNSISERVKDILSNTVGIIFAPLFSSLDESLGDTNSKFESILEKDIFQRSKPMVKRIDGVSIEPGFSTLDGLLRMTREIVNVVDSSFDLNEPMQAPQRRRTHPQHNSLARLPFMRTSTAPPGRLGEKWEPDKAHNRVQPDHSSPISHKTQPKIHDHVQPDHSIQISAMPAIAEESQTGDRYATSRPTAHASRSSPIPFSKDERRHGIMEEEKIAGLYFEKWDLQSAMHWYLKARQLLSQEVFPRRYDNIEISIASTWNRLGQFEKAARVLDDILMTSDELPSLNFQSVMAQCRSLCCTSSQAYREVVANLVSINEKYKAMPERGPCELTQMNLNIGCLASLRLLLGDNKTAKADAVSAVLEWEILLRDQKLDLDSLQGQLCNHQSTEQQSQIEDDGSLLKSAFRIKSKETEFVHRDAGKRLVDLKGQIENTTKNLLESEFRLVKTDTELGHIDKALKSNKELLRRMKMLWGSDHVVTLRALNFHSRLLLLQEEYSEAEAMCKNSLRCMADHLGPEHYITLDFIGTLVKIYITQGRWKEAHDIAETLVVRNRLAIGENHPQTIESEVDLAHLLELVGNTVTAEKFQRSVHEKCERILGPFHPTSLISRSRLASVYFNAGRFGDAEDQVRAVSRYLDPEKTAREDHQSLSIATARKTIGVVARKLASRHRSETSSRHHDSGNEARKLSDELFRISEDHLGEAMKFHEGALQNEHADILSGRFEQYLIKRDREEKMDDKLLRDLHNIMVRRRAGSGGSHPEVATMQHELSFSYAIIGGWEDARRLESAALEARLQSFETYHPDILNSRLQLAPILWCVGQMEEAVKQLTRAHDTISQRPSNFPAFDLLSIKANLANTLVEIGQYKEAAKLQEQLVSESKGKDSYLAARNDLAFIYQKLGRLDYAEREYDEIEKELSNRCSVTSSKPDLFVMIVKSNRASLHMKKGEYARAERLQREVKKILKAHPAYGELNRDTITCRYNLAVVLKNQDEDKKAEKQLRKALQNMEKLAGKDHVESKDMDAKLQQWTKSSTKRRMGLQVSKPRSRGNRRDSGCAASD